MDKSLSMLTKGTFETLYFVFGGERAIGKRQYIDDSIKMALQR
jgi:hypothetical protein